QTYRTGVIDFQVQLAFAQSFFANARTQPPAIVASTSDRLFTFRKSRLSCSVTDISRSFPDVTRRRTTFCNEKSEPASAVRKAISLCPCPCGAIRRLQAAPH